MLTKGTKTQTQTQTHTDTHITNWVSSEHMAAAAAAAAAARQSKLRLGSTTIMTWADDPPALWGFCAGPPPTRARR